VEVVESSESPKHRHTWLEWLGLEEPPPEPDSWIPVARGFGVEDSMTQSSILASRLVDLLTGAGIDAHQRSYKFMTGSWSLTSVAGGSVTRVAVLVHNRDRERATEIATELKQKLDRQGQELEHRLDSAEQDLAREPLDADPPPEA
jgi:hypothetical protein